MKKNMSLIVIVMLVAGAAAGCSSGTSSEQLPAQTAPTTFSLTGTVTSAGAGMAGVTLALSSSASTTMTDGNGTFTFSGLTEGNYVITPSRSGYAFFPYRGGVYVSDRDVSGVEFIASDQPYTVTGLVADDPIAGAQVAVTDADDDALIGEGTTDDSGAYAIPVFSQPPYRIIVKGGTAQGSPFPGEFSAYCETADNCHASPYTSAIDLLMRDDGFGFSEAAAKIMGRIGIAYDPFLREMLGGAAVPDFEFDLAGARAALASKDAIAAWIAGLAEAAKNRDAPLPAGALPPATNSLPGACFQGLHIIGGSGTDPAQNDLLYQLYKWAKASGDCGELRATYYTGIEVLNPSDSLYKVRDQVRANICYQISEGVRDIYIFGFSRGAVMAVTMADVETLCPDAIARRTDGADIVKFVGIVDPVNTDMNVRDWTLTLPFRLASNDRSVRIHKTVTQGLGPIQTGNSDKMQWQQFYFDTTGRIRIFGNMCLQEEADSSGWLGTVNKGILEIATCDGSLMSQRFEAVQIDPPCNNCIVDLNTITTVTKFLIRTKNRTGNQYVIRTSSLKYEFGLRLHTSPDKCQQVFIASPGDRGLIRNEIDCGEAKCLSADWFSKDPGTAIVPNTCEPHNEGGLQILSTATMYNVAKDVPVRASWHQDLTCTLDVADDGLSYPTNAKVVEDNLVTLAQSKGLNFYDNRTRRPCDDSKSLRPDPKPLSKTVGAYSLFGTITSSATGSAIAGVTVRTNTGSPVAITNSQGRYTFTELPSGNYVITPAKPGSSFTPAARSVTIINMNVAGQDFVGN